MVTTHTAHVKNGIIVPDTPLSLPEGHEVELRVKRNGTASGDHRPANGLAGHPKGQLTAIETARAYLADESNLTINEEDRKRDYAALYRHTVATGSHESITNEEIDALLAAEYGSDHNAEPTGS